MLLRRIVHRSLQFCSSFYGYGYVWLLFSSRVLSHSGFTVAALALDVLALACIDIGTALSMDGPLLLDYVLLFCYNLGLLRLSFRYLYFVQAASAPTGLKEHFCIGGSVSTLESKFVPNGIYCGILLADKLW